PFTDLYQIAEDFIGRCERIQVQGIHKLKKKCQSELKFLQSLRGRAKVATHLKSSNLGHFSAILHCVENLPQPTTVLKPFPYPGRDSLPIDVIVGEGHLWVKVIARKAQALHLVWAGQGQFGEKTLIDQAQEYLHLATLNQVNFRTPRVCYAFYSGITKPMAAALTELGILVLGELVDVSLDVQTKLSSLEDLDLDSKSDIESSDLESSEGDLEEGNSVGMGREGQKVLMCGNSDAFNPVQGTVADKKSAVDVITRKVDQVPDKGTDPGQRLGTVESTEPSEHHSDEIRGESSPPCSKVAETCVARKAILHSAQTSHSSSDKRNCMAKNIQTVVSQNRPKFRLGMGRFDESLSGRDPLKPSVIFDPSPVKKVNLDVTALIALISAVTHGRCYFIFEDDILSEQAAEERRCPVLPKMKEFLQGKDMFACQSAVTAFNTILHTLGGPSERALAAELMTQVTVVPDCPSSRTQRLPTSSKIKHRSKVIFGTGDELMMVTLTANSGFVRAAKNHGVNYAVFLHAARALTEAKEKGAKKIEVETGEAVT
ncbi:UPF0415 protein C7orf25 homolog, partial [Liolophura sinensis]|uniref:UPF0415 protein C7orf25 homolog n=1 Tax=Liolophura sinensis TaxID=3198878 RepID=UPI003157FCE6